MLLDPDGSVSEQVDEAVEILPVDEDARLAHLAGLVIPLAFGDDQVRVLVLGALDLHRVGAGTDRVEVVLEECGIRLAVGITIARRTR
jgi:hypothetical protein